MKPAHRTSPAHWLLPLSLRVQVFSQVNKMSAHNLAVVLAPSLFQAMNQDLITLTREFIIHHTLLFLVSLLLPVSCFYGEFGLS